MGFLDLEVVFLVRVYSLVLYRIGSLVLWFGGGYKERGGSEFELLGWIDVLFLEKIVLLLFLI